MVSATVAVTISAWAGQVKIEGSGAIRSAGDGELSASARINGPWRITFDLADNLYVYERNDGPRDVIRRIDASTRIVTTLQATACDFAREPNPEPRPAGCFGPVGQLRASGPSALLFSEYLWGRLRKLSLKTFSLSTIAGNGQDESRGDGGPAIDASFHGPMCFAVDHVGNIFVCDSNRIRRIDAATGVITTVAGTGARGSAGDGGPAIAAEINPTALAVDSNGDLYLSDSVPVANQGSLGPGLYRIRRIRSQSGIIETIAGNSEGVYDESGFKGYGEPALQAELSRPEALTLDGLGHLIFINGEFTIGRVDLKSGRLYRVAGNGQPGAMGDGGPALGATVDAVDLAIDSNSNLFLADWQDNRIRRIDAKTGIITTFAGNGLPHRKPPAYQ